MTITKTSIDWTARDTQQQAKRQRRRLHKKMTRGCVEPPQHPATMTPHGPSFLSRAVHLFGGTMIKPVNLDTYDR